MQELRTAPPRDFAAASGIFGDAYVASLSIAITGEGTSRRVETDGGTFETLVTVMQMRPQAFEPRTREFRPHHVKSALVLQRLDRLWPSIETLGGDNPKLVRVAEQLRDLAELSDTVSWQLA